MFGVWAVHAGAWGAAVKKDAERGDQRIPGLRVPRRIANWSDLVARFEASERERAGRSARRDLIYD